MSKMAVFHSPTAADTMAAPIKINCMYVRYWSMKRSHPGLAFSSGSSLGPWALSNAAARSGLWPSAGSTPSADATSAPPSAYQSTALSPEAAL